MQLSIRASGKTARLELPDGATVADLLSAIASSVGISASRQQWKGGFPPRIIDIDKAGSFASTSLESTGLRHRDAVIVEESSTALRDFEGTVVTTEEPGRAAPASSSAASYSAKIVGGGAASASQSQLPASSSSTTGLGTRPPTAALCGPPPLPQSAAVERHVIPADNSCLFAAVLFNLKNDCAFSPTLLQNDRFFLQTAGPHHLREHCGKEIASTPCDYDAFTLAECGKTSFEYAGWIQESSSWGGFLELSLLSKLCNVQIAACDIQNCRLEYFPHLSDDGGTAAVPRPAARMFVFFDGIHYDACCASAGPGGRRTLFALDDDDVVAQVLSVGMALKEQKQYTDTANFTLQCQHCFKLLVGEKDAQSHAKETGHFNFQEAPK
mmetsp:Transcript_8731/g.21209  ORF Transcript_8731/g.21209 Transcript_8731/m.21209 type:complete len:383 (+) Transcript_8731:681-1829(+)|eukprot:g1756.t1